MTWGDFGQLLTGLASVGAMVLSWLNRSDIREVKHATNSMKDELVKVTGESEHAKGVIQGVIQARAEGA